MRSVSNFNCLFLTEKIVAIDFCVSVYENAKVNSSECTDRQLQSGKPSLSRQDPPSSETEDISILNINQ